MSTAELIHYWVTLSAAVLLVVSVVVMLIGAAHPVPSARGNRTMAVGVAALLAVVAAYLVYAATAITYVVVIRS